MIKDFGLSVDDLIDDVMNNYPMVKIEDTVQGFSLEIYDPISDEIVKKNISDYQWKWLAIVFYPADFTFVCPTELKDLNKSYDQFKELWNVELLVASTDSVFSHKWWVENESLLKWFKIPMIADRTTVLTRYFGILNHITWNAERWTFVISPKWVLKTIEVSTEPVGRSAKDLIRKLKALKFTTENPWQVCPASWDTDMPVLTPSIKIAWHIGESIK